MIMMNLTMRSALRTLTSWVIKKTKAGVCYFFVRDIRHADAQCPGGTFSKWTVSKIYLLAGY